MKTVTIESIIAIYYPETALAYAQIINTVVNYPMKGELRYGMKVLTEQTDAHKHFHWGFGKRHLWVKQRNGYESPELFDNRILIVKFDN